MRRWKTIGVVDQDRFCFRSVTIELTALLARAPLDKEVQQQLIALLYPLFASVAQIANGIQFSSATSRLVADNVKVEMTESRVDDPARTVRDLVALGHRLLPIIGFGPPYRTTAGLTMTIGNFGADAARALNGAFALDKTLFQGVKPFFTGVRYLVRPDHTTTVRDISLEPVFENPLDLHISSRGFGEVGGFQSLEQCEHFAIAEVSGRAEFCEIRSRRFSSEKWMTQAEAFLSGHRDLGLHGDPCRRKGGMIS